MDPYRSFAPSEVSRLLLLIVVDKSNSIGFSAEIRIIWWHSPAQSSLRHPRKGRLPEMRKSNRRFVIWLEAGMVPSTVLISRRTTDFRALPLMDARSANTRRRERSLRSTRPARGSWSAVTEKIIILGLVHNENTYRRHIA
jgi:hypothetical protein